MVTRIRMPAVVLDDLDMGESKSAPVAVGPARVAISDRFAMALLTVTKYVVS